MEIHHVEEHHKGGPTSLENGALVHKKDCHPKGAKATAEFATKWAALKASRGLTPDAAPAASNNDVVDDEDEENDADVKLTG